MDALLLHVHHLAVAMSNLTVAAGAFALFGGWTLKTYIPSEVVWLLGPKYVLSARMSFARLLPNIPYVNRRSDCGGNGNLARVVSLGIWLHDLLSIWLGREGLLMLHPRSVPVVLKVLEDWQGDLHDTLTYAWGRIVEALVSCTILGQGNDQEKEEP